MRDSSTPRSALSTKMRNTLCRAAAAKTQTRRLQFTRRPLTTYVRSPGTGSVMNCEDGSRQTTSSLLSKKKTRCEDGWAGYISVAWRCSLGPGLRCLVCGLVGCRWVCWGYHGVIARFYLRSKSFCTGNSAVIFCSDFARTSDANKQWVKTKQLIACQHVHHPTTFTAPPNRPPPPNNQPPYPLPSIWECFRVS